MKHILKFIAGTFLFINCTGVTKEEQPKKIRLDENLTYKVFLDESYLKNSQVASVFETIDETYDQTLTANVESIVLLNTTMYKYTEDSDTVGGLFSNTMTTISALGSVVSLVFENASQEVKIQVSILSDLEDTFNEEITYKINSDLKELLINLYPLLYLIEKNGILNLDNSDRTIEFFNSNLKINKYLVDELVPTYSDVVSSFCELNRTVVLNKLNKSQIDSLKLQLLSLDDNYGQFENRGAIKKFKKEYLKFSNLKDLKKSSISEETEFLNEKTLNGIKAYVNLQDSNLKKLISFLGSNDQVSVQKVLIGDYPIFTIKKYETHNSKIRDLKFEKILKKLNKI